MTKKLSFFTFLMLLVPLVTWAMQWKWTLAIQYQLFDVDFWLLLLTETGSTPYALITCVLFMLWIMWLTRTHYSWLLVGFICATSVVGTQVIKEGAKKIFQEPRPFVTEMFTHHTEEFYQQPKIQQREQVMRMATTGSAAIVSHQAEELGYSFPSGHTIFAVSWLLVFGGFLAGLRGQAVILTQLFALCWAGLMLISRLRLGMHYPIDLFVSTLIAWAFNLLLFSRVVPYLETWAVFKKRGA